MASFDLKKATLKIKDGGSNTMTVTIGEGNLTYTERRNVEFQLNRGDLETGSVRLGDDVPVDVTFSFTWEYIEGVGATISVEDALKKQNGAAAWVSAGADACEPYSVDLEFKLDNNCGSSDVETFLFGEFHYTELQHDARAATVSVTGQCKVTVATVTRSDT